MKLIKAVIYTLCLCFLLYYPASAQSFEKTVQYHGGFTDVTENDWFADSIKEVYEFGLMDGISDNKFDIHSEMKVSQAVTIAARLNSIYTGNEITGSTFDAKWYDKYVRYCKEQGIIKDSTFDSFDRSVMAFEMVTLYSKALPDEFYPRLNNISYVQDVPKDIFFADDVLKFYRAGILNGNDDYGTFLPTSTVTRMRGAVILARVANPENRLHFSLLPQRQNYSLDEALTILSYQAQSETLDGITLISSPIGNVSAAEYRYYLKLFGSNKDKINYSLLSDLSVIQVAKKVNIDISPEDLDKMLNNYYTAKLAYYGNGISYADIIASKNLSDKVFSKLCVTTELVPLTVSKIFSTVEPNTVFEYAQNNDYICVKHILITKDTPNAYSLISDINALVKADEDFDSLIEQYGMDSSMESRPDGMIITKGQSHPSFEKAAFALDENGISSIVRSDYGYHIIKRIPLTNEILSDSPDYSYVSASAALWFFNSECKKAEDMTVFTYTENFDKIVHILD